MLAAGKGTRLQTGDKEAPKVMRTACGKPLLWYVLDALSFIDKKNVVIVVGFMKNEVMDYFSSYRFTEQKEQLGTGHAVMVAGEELRGFDGAVLVCYGDMPAVKEETYKALVRAHFCQGNDCTILTGESAIRLPYGRIIRDKSDGFLQVVEESDCTPEQLMVTELNSGVYMFRAKMLIDSMNRLDNDNAQGEYYLTDLPAIMRTEGARIGIYKRDLGDEIIGVNTLEQLVQIDEILRRRNGLPR